MKLKLGKFVNYRSKNIVEIAWHFPIKIEYSLEVSLRPSGVKISDCSAFSQLTTIPGGRACGHCV